MEELKKCRGCQEEKPLIKFQISKLCKGGYSKTCKMCLHERYKEKSQKKQRENYHNNKEKYLKAVKDYRKNNLEKYKAIKKRPWYRIHTKISQRINDWLENKGLQKGFKTPCSIKILKAHIESKMRIQMSWDNYGKSDGWCIDHIKPLSSWNLFDEDERKAANQPNNLQCLWLKENEAKSKSYDPDHPMGWHGLNDLLSEEDKELLSERLGYKF